MKGQCRLHHQNLTLAKSFKAEQTGALAAEHKVQLESLFIEMVRHPLEQLRVYGATGLARRSLIPEAQAPNRKGRVPFLCC